MYVERPSHEPKISNLLAKTLTVFLGVVLTKRYTNPSADIITLLSGLDEVDAVFFEFANALESIIRTGESRESLKFQASWQVLMGYS